MCENLEDNLTIENTDTFSCANINNRKKEKEKKDKVQLNFVLDQTIKQIN